MSQPGLSGWSVSDIASVLTAIGTILLAFAAAFQDKIKLWILRARLDARVNVAPPDCHKTKLTSLTNLGSIMESECYYFRFVVENVGDYKAEYVEAYAESLSKKKADGTYKDVETFMPMDLKWSIVDIPILSAISPHTKKYCNIGHILNPIKRPSFPLFDNKTIGLDPSKTFLSLDQEVLANTKGYLIPPGDYCLTLKIGAANARQITKVLEITHKGDWYDEQERMFADGIGMIMK